MGVRKVSHRSRVRGFGRAQGDEMIETEGDKDWTERGFCRSGVQCLVKAIWEARG